LKLRQGFAFGQRLIHRGPHVLQQIKPGHLGDGEGGGVFLLPHILPVEGRRVTFGAEIIDRLSGRQRLPVADLQRHSSFACLGSVRTPN
jgi:hypothetical protein